MSFDWSAYWALAKELAARTDEASLRSSVSRAYYSAYHSALNAVELNVEGIRDSHKTVVEYYERAANSTMRGIANRLAGLHRDRLNADYRANPSCTVAKADAVLMKAKRIVDDVEGIPERDLKYRRA